MSPPTAPSSESAKNDWQQVAPALEQLLDAAQPYRGAIQALAEETTNSEQRKRLLDIVQQLSGEKSAGEVFDNGWSIDPAEIEALCWTPGNSPHAERLKQGNSATAIPRFSRHAESVSVADRVIWQTIAYPALLFLSLMAFALSMWSMIVPEFQLIFDDFELPIPPPTQFVLNMRPFLLLGILGCLAVLGVWFFRYQLFDASFRKSAAFRTPWMGGIYRNAGYGKFCHVASLLLKSGAPVAPALRVAARGTLPVFLVPELQASLDPPSSFPPPVPSSWSTSILPVRLPKRLTLAVTSELERDQKGDMFRELASDYYFRASNHARRSVQPVVVLLAGVAIGFVVVALFMPLVSLITNLSG